MNVPPARQVRRAVFQLVGLCVLGFAAESFLDRSHDQPPPAPAAQPRKGAATAAPGPLSIQKADSLLAQADAHWDAQRFDLAAQEYAEFWKTHPPSADRDRAGVLAARALYELGHRDEAKKQLEAVATGATHELWWARCLYDLARLAPRHVANFPTPQDSIRLVPVVAGAKRRLEQAIDVLSSRADSDSAWASTLAACRLELLYRAASVEELDTRLAEELEQKRDAESEANLRLAYADALMEFPQRRFFLPELRQQERERISEHRTRALQYVVEELPNTSAAPKAALALVQREGGDAGPGDAEALEQIIARYPTSPEATRARQMLQYLRQSLLRAQASPLQLVWAPGDSVRIQVKAAQFARPDPVTVRIVKLNRRQAMEWRVRQGEERIELSGWRQSKEVNVHCLGGTRPDTTIALMLSPGFYAGEVTGHSATTFSFQVSGHRLLTTAGPHSIHALIASPDARPIAKAEVEIYDVRRVPKRKGWDSIRFVKRGTWRIDENGRIDIPTPARKAASRKEPSTYRQILIVSHRDDEFDMQLHRFEERAQRTVVLWTDRTIYRPGEEMQFAALCLAGPVYAMTPAESESLVVRASFPAMRHSGDSTPEIALETDRFGMAHGTFLVSEAAGDGKCSVSASHRDGVAVSISATPTIRTFVRLDFELTVDASEKEVAPGETLEVRVGARTPQGMPLSGARLTCSVDKVRMSRRYGLQDEPVAQGWYGPADGRAVDSHFRVFPEARLVHKQLILDGDGNARLKVRTPPRPSQMTVTDIPGVIAGLAIEVALDDASGRYRTTQLGIPIFPGRAWCSAGKGGVAQLQGFPVAVTRVDNTNRPDPGRIFYRWNRQTPDLERDRYIETLIHSGSIETQGNAVARIEPPGEDAADMVLDVWADPEASEATRFAWPQYPRWRGSTARGADRSRTRHTSWVALDRVQYSLGDTASLLLSADVRSKPGVLELTGGRPGHRFARLLTAGSDSVVRLPITPDHIPEAFVTWRSLLPEASSLWSTVENNRIIPPTPPAQDRIVVEPSSRSLSIALTTDRPGYAPGDSIRVDVRATDSNGGPVAATLAVGAVDEAVYALEPDPLDLLRALYRLSPLDRDHVSEAITFSAPPGAPPPGRIAFRATAFWAPRVVTDPVTGSAVIRAKLPDDLARWRITARASDLAGRIGEARAHFTTERPLAIRSRLPQFARAGDWFEFDILIDNYMPQKLDCEVTWNSDALQPVSKTKTRIRILAGHSSSMRFAARTGEVGAANVRLAVRGGAHGDSLLQTLPVIDGNAELAHLPEPGPVHIDLADVLHGVRPSVLEVRGNHSEFYSADEDLRLLLAFVRGCEVLDQRGERMDGDVPSPSPTLIKAVREKLVWEHRNIRREMKEPVDLNHQAGKRARFASDLKRARERGWKLGGKRDLKAMGQWLERAVQDTALNEDERVDVATSHHVVDEKAVDGLEAAWSAWRLLGPGARALLATSLAKTQPAEAALLTGSATGYARWTPDSAFAHYRFGTEHHPGVFSPERTSAIVLRAVALENAQRPIARALANASIIQLAAAGWSGGEDLGDMVSAAAEYMYAWSATPGTSVLDAVATATPDMLEFDREVKVRAASGGHRALVRGSPDTVRCQVGDTLLVWLSSRAPLFLGPAEIASPIPSGTTTLSGKWAFPERAAWFRSVSDHHILISTYLSPAESVFEHALLADRVGTFLIPPARLHLTNLPTLQAASKPLVVVIARRSGERR